jgi:hypothetical protein
VIYGHDVARNCVDSGASGRSEILGNDVVVSLGAFARGVGTPTQQLGTTIHEIGHNFSLTHNGNDDPSQHFSCIHTSPMNYRYQMDGWGTTAVPQLRRFSYSRGVCDASHLNCTNTCTGGCVPAGQFSPKNGCGTSGGTCDCDVSECASVNLNFPHFGDDLTVTHNNTPGAPESVLREYFLGDSRRFTKCNASP